MATITLEYNPHLKDAVDLLSRITESGFFTIKTTSKRKNGMEEAMKDIEMGRVYKAKDVEDLFKQLER
jgi:predicted transcriptional regulator